MRERSHRLGPIERTRRAARAISIVALLGVPGCDVSRDLAEIRAQNAAILEKLDAIAARQDEIATGGRDGAGERAGRAAPEDFDRVYEIPVGSSPVRGRPDARVTIVEFSDFQCPYCARSQPLLDQLAEKYPDDVRFVFKHYPLSFHPAALPLALASAGAQDQGKFWAFRKILFERQAEIQPIQSDQKALADAILRYARDAGIDLERFAADINANQASHQALVRADLETGRAADVRGTPSLYIDGRKVPGREWNLAAMSARIEAALAEAGGS